MGDFLSAKTDELGSIEIDAFDEFYSSLYRFAELCIRDAEYCCVLHCWMGEQDVLNFSRINIHPTGDDHMGRTICQVEIPLLVQVSDVSQRRPAAIIVRTGSFQRVLEVLELRPA